MGTVLPKTEVRMGPVLTQGCTQVGYTHPGMYPGGIHTPERYTGGIYTPERYTGGIYTP